MWGGGGEGGRGWKLLYLWAGKWLILGKEGFSWGTRSRGKLYRLTIKWTNFSYTLRVPSTGCFKSTLREKCPNTELFLAHIFLYSEWILETRSISPYSVIQSKYRKIRTRNNSVFGHFPRSAIASHKKCIFLKN